MAHAGIATFWKPVINVTDLDEGERFWSAVTGLRPAGRHGQFMEYSSLDAEDPSQGDPWILLQLVTEHHADEHGGTHLDFRVEDVAAAVRGIEEIGGTVVKPAGSYPDVGQPMLEWAVMEDPFGNRFCIIKWPLS